MICPVTSQCHRFEAPFPNKHLEHCRDCGIWRIHSEDSIVWLPPPNVLAAPRKNHFSVFGKLIPFRRRWQQLTQE